MSDIVTDKQLVDSYLKGDVESFKILMARYENKIFSYLLMLVKDRQVAEDLFQDTFLKRKILCLIQDLILFLSVIFLLLPSILSQGMLTISPLSSRQAAPTLNCE